MRRSCWQRVVGSLIGLWFAIAVPGVVLPLQVLDGGDSAIAGMANMPGMDHHGATPCPQRATTRGAPDAQGGSGVPAKHHHHTGCDGACCAPATVTLAGGRLVAIPVVPMRAVAAAPCQAPALPPQVADQVTLPPPLGPPTLRA
jgi:hypothetical protein